MKKQILSEEFRRMQKLAGIITENDMSNDMSRKPEKITVKINQNKNRDGRSFSPNEISLDTESYVLVGEDKEPNQYSNPPGMKMLYFAKYVPEQNEIQVFKAATKEDARKGDLTRFFYTKFESIEVGQEDDQGFFTIVGIK